MRHTNNCFAVFLLFFLAAVSAGCDTSVSFENSAEDTRQALLETDRAFAKATAEKGLEGFASYLAEDVWFLNDGSPILKGKEAAAKSWETLLADADTSFTWEPVRAEAAASGEMGYTIGQYVIKGKTSEGKAFTEKGKYFTAWEKQPDGSWKVVVDGGNTDGPAEVEE